MHRLAGSERVRQAFVRHAFRYWMRRKETLIAADRADVRSKGSFAELLASHLTGDCSLNRR